MTKFAESLPETIIEKLPLTLYTQLLDEAPFKIIRDRIYVATAREGKRLHGSVAWSLADPAESIRNAYNLHLQNILSIPNATIKRKSKLNMTQSVYINRYSCPMGYQKQKIDAVVTINGKKYQKTFSIGILFKPEEILHAYITAKYWVYLTRRYCKPPADAVFNNWKGRKVYGKLTYEKAHLMG